MLSTLEEPGIGIPVIGIRFKLGRQLYQTEGARVSLDIQTKSVLRQTANIIADTKGRAARTVVVGAHLDSVPEGPGINDNGSGTATILETALQISKLGIEPTNEIRFAFWGAEFGLLGSEYYVENLPDKELNEIALNLNLTCSARPTSCASSTTATAPRRPTTPTTPARRARPR